MERLEDASPLVMGEQVPFAKMAEPYGRASTGRVKSKSGLCLVWADDQTSKGRP